MLAAQAGGVSRAVLEAVAIEAYRSGAITTAQVQQMLGLRSRGETESFLRRAEAFHDYTAEELELARNNLESPRRPDALCVSAVKPTATSG